MFQIELAIGARKIVEVCAGAKPGENLLILTDTGISPRIAEALAIAGKAAGTQVVVMTMSPLSKPGEEPPSIVAAAMAEADIILSPTTRSVYHSQATKTASAKGARLIALTELTENAMIHGGIEADFIALQPRVEMLMKAFEAGKKVHVSAPGGTDLYLEIDGRKPYACSGICDKPGDKMGFPEMEVFIAPLETKTNGALVIDGSATAMGLIEQPIRLCVEQGYVKEIVGTAKADQLRAILKNTDDPQSYVIAEFALGLNDKSKVVGNIIEDEGAYGTGHFALGSNIFFGGENKAPMHLDMVYWEPSVEIDGKWIMRKGVLIEE